MSKYLIRVINIVIRYDLGTIIVGSKNVLSSNILR